MAKKTLQDVAQKMAEAIMEWNRAKREREEWKPIPGQTPPMHLLGNAKHANILLASALEEYEDFQQSVHLTGGTDPQLTSQEELLNRLQKANDLQKELARKSNDELANLLLEKVWADVELFTYNSELITVVIERLRSNHPNGPQTHLEEIKQNS